METIKLIREKIAGKAVMGTMTFYIGDKQLNYPSLENADFIIPAGTYPVSLTWSPKFKKLMPLIENVPEREGIRIIGVPKELCSNGESGADPSTFSQTEFELVYEGLARDDEHSEGCILTNAAAMYNLTILFNRVDKYNKEFKEENEPNEEVCIEISDPDDARA